MDVVCGCVSRACCAAQLSPGLLIHDGPITDDQSDISTQSRNVGEDLCPIMALYKPRGSDKSRSVAKPQLRAVTESNEAMANQPLVVNRQSAIVSPD